MKPLLFMAGLAGLDLVGAVLAKRFSQTGSAIVLLAGIAVFGVLFIVYAKGVGVSELSIVTIGWVSLLQVGVIALDLIDGRLRLTPAVIAVLAMTVGLQLALVKMAPA